MSDRKRPHRHNREGHQDKKTGKMTAGSVVNAKLPPGKEEPKKRVSRKQQREALMGTQLTFDDYAEQVKLDNDVVEALGTTRPEDLWVFAGSPSKELRIATTKNRNVPLPFRRDIVEHLVANDPDVDVKVAALESGLASQDVIEELWRTHTMRSPVTEPAIKRAMAQCTRSVATLNDMSQSDDWTFRAGAARNQFADDENISDKLVDDPEIMVQKEVARSTQKEHLLDRLAQHNSAVVLQSVAENPALNQRKNLHLLQPPSPDSVRYAFAANLKHADILHTQALNSDDVDVLFGIIHNQRAFSHTIEVLTNHSNETVANVARLRPGRPKETIGQ
jgi:hypothetical protein